MFDKLRKLFIYKLGGFVTIDDAIASITAMNLTDRHLILTHAVKRLYNTISADDILKEVAGGTWMLEGKAMSDAQKKQLIAEARNFIDSSLWKLLQKDIKYQANRKMYLLGKTDIDLIAGKLWLYTLDAIKTRLTSMSNESGIYSKPS